jgi:hypothetical protein
VNHVAHYDAAIWQPSFSDAKRLPASASFGKPAGKVRENGPIKSWQAQG